MVNVLPLSSIWGIGWEGWAKSPQSFFSLSFLVPPACLQKEKQVQVIFVCSFISSWVPISVLRILYIHTCSVRSFVRCLGCLLESLTFTPALQGRTQPTTTAWLPISEHITAIIYALFIHALACGLKTLKSLLLLLLLLTLTAYMNPSRPLRPTLDNPKLFCSPNSTRVQLASAKVLTDFFIIQSAISRP